MEKEDTNIFSPENFN